VRVGRSQPGRGELHFPRQVSNYPNKGALIRTWTARLPLSIDKNCPSLNCDSLDSVDFEVVQHEEDGERKCEKNVEMQSQCVDVQDRQK
jgi:hypothetical protein